MASQPSLDAHRCPATSSPPAGWPSIRHNDAAAISLSCTHTTLTARPHARTHSTRHHTPRGAELAPVCDDQSPRAREPVSPRQRASPCAYILRVVGRCAVYTVPCPGFLDCRRARPTYPAPRRTRRTLAVAQIRIFCGSGTRHPHARRLPLSTARRITRSRSTGTTVTAHKHWVIESPKPK